MRSPAGILGHPFHPMLIPFPIGWWVLSLICDVFMLLNGDVIWGIFALYTMAGGIIAALIAALPGFVDLFTMKPSPVKRIGIWHMGINLLVTVLYVVDFLWRRHGGPAATGPVVLSVIAVLLLVMSGWLGGEMVFVHGVAVDTDGEQKS
jgi:uncharacterized membrane protein